MSAAASFESLAGRIADWTAAAGRRGETVLTAYRGDCGDWARMSRGRIRQSGRIDRHRVVVELIVGGARARAGISVAPGGPALRSVLDRGLAELRRCVADAQPDPYGGIDRNPRVALTGLMRPDAPKFDDCVRALVEAARGLDLVGSIVCGPRASGFASNLGHRLLHLAHDGFVDCAVFDDQGPAVKTGFVIDSAVPDFGSGFDRIRAERALLSRSAHVPSPGRYRAWLAPRAVADVFECIAPHGFSERGLRTGASALTALRDGAQAWSPMCTIDETPGALGVPPFDDDGHARAARLALVASGRWAGALVGPRSALEFGLEPNGAGLHEAADALSLGAGRLPDDEICRALGTGLLITNLWYLNLVDARAGRLTGMTRFASVWVEDGKAVAPLAPMRIDDSVHRMFGSKLEALGAQRSSFVPTESWEFREWGCMRMPGALLGELGIVS